MRRESCACAKHCGDDGDIDGPGICRMLPFPPLPPLVEIVLVPRDAVAVSPTHPEEPR